MPSVKFFPSKLSLCRRNSSGTMCLSSDGVTIFNSSGFLVAASSLMALLRDALERDLVVRFSMTGSVLVRLAPRLSSLFSLFTPAAFFVVVFFFSSPSFFLPPPPLLLRDGTDLLVVFSSSFGLAPTLRPLLGLVVAATVFDDAVDFFLVTFCPFGAAAAAATLASDSAMTLSTLPCIENKSPSKKRGIIVSDIVTNQLFVHWRNAEPKREGMLNFIFTYQRRSATSSSVIAIINVTSATVAQRVTRRSSAHCLLRLFMPRKVI